MLHVRTKFVHAKDSNELYVSVEFKFKRKKYVRCTSINTNVVSSVNSDPVDILETR